MNRRQLKKQILVILESSDFGEVKRTISQFAPSAVINPLFTALCSVDDRIRHNAVAAFGVIVPALANEDMESARVVMRRFLWTLNDESGGIGWGAPEAMAEIMACDSRLAGEYLHMLLSYMREDGEERFQDGNYLELPLLQRGLLWGVARLCSTRKELMLANDVVKDLKGYLGSDDAVVRGLAIWSLCLLGDTTLRQEIRRLKGDTTCFSVMKDGEATTLSTGELIECYLSRANQDP